MVDDDIRMVCSNLWERMIFKSGNKRDGDHQGRGLRRL
jgi:hypothetical protein